MGRQSNFNSGLYKVVGPLGTLSETESNPMSHEAAVRMAIRLNKENPGEKYKAFPVREGNSYWTDKEAQAKSQASAESLGWYIWGLLPSKEWVNLGGPYTSKMEVLDKSDKFISGSGLPYLPYTKIETSKTPPGRLKNGLFSSSPSDSAKELARDFHGRDNKGIKEYTLASYYPKDLAELGILIELQVFTDDDREAYVPINFAPEHPDLTDDDSNVILAANGNRKQLYLVGGDQEYDLTEFAETAGIDFPDDELEKDEVVLGEVKAIAYFADKHHLEGPKEQKTGIPYQHEFAINEETGEQIGEYPTLVYSQRDKVFKLVGGSYEILPEGISG